MPLKVDKCTLHLLSSQFGENSKRCGSHGILFSSQFHWCSKQEKLHVSLQLLSHVFLSAVFLTYQTRRKFLEVLPFHLCQGYVIFLQEKNATLQNLFCYSFALVALLWIFDKQPLQLSLKVKKWTESTRTLELKLIIRVNNLIFL